MKMSEAAWRGSVHFVGVGGVGMSGIAEVLIRMGFTVSGCDIGSGEITSHLESIGAEIWQGHDASHVHGAQAVVYSSAVRLNNPELIEARAQGIPVIRRAEMLGELMRIKTGIGIAGTHGKTTTTSLIGTVLTRAGLDPTVIVGGMVRDMDTNARLGAGELLVAEADEYDRSFLRLTPTIAVLTNVEPEHLDTYDTFDNLRDAFVHFANTVPFYGRVVLCLDDPELRSLRPCIERTVLTYGFSEDAQVRGRDPEVGLHSRCRVEWEGEELGWIELPLAGMHNLTNALAAVAVARELEVPFDRIQKALAAFRGVRRRFDLRGEIGGITVIDDYAHHPTEVAVTLLAAKNAYAGRKIVALFQPHLFSRTQRLHGQFAEALKQADQVYVTDVYPSREDPVEGVTGQLVTDDLTALGYKNVSYVQHFQDIVPTVLSALTGGEVVITLGAGNIYQASAELLGRLAEREEGRRG